MSHTTALDSIPEPIVLRDELRETLHRAKILRQLLRVSIRVASPRAATQTPTTGEEKPCR
jgi:hypothetical protein